jgi:hypothetical protein
VKLLSPPTAGLLGTLSWGDTNSALDGRLPATVAAFRAGVNKNNNAVVSSTRTRALNAYYVRYARIARMATKNEDDGESEPELGNGDTLSERLEDVDLTEDETVSTDELREQLDL